MNELDHLKSMWGLKIKRTTKLIVPDICFVDGVGTMKTDLWQFKVSFAFRDALDIKYEQRKKNKKPYMVWTQGPIINFKNWDLLKSKDGRREVQIQYANPMGWDASRNEMYQGSVVYDDYTISNNKYTKTDQQICTQIEFLQMLIYGQSDC